jgi:hypothetical protein
VTHEDHLVATGTDTKKKLAPDAHLSEIQVLEHRSFFIGDVFLFVVVIFFFAVTLLSRSDNTGSMHNGTVISEFITLLLQWLQLVYLFWSHSVRLTLNEVIPNPPTRLLGNTNTSHGI